MMSDNVVRLTDIKGKSLELWKELCKIGDCCFRFLPIFAVPKYMSDRLKRLYKVILPFVWWW